MVNDVKSISNRIKAIRNIPHDRECSNYIKIVTWIINGNCGSPGKFPVVILNNQNEFCCKVQSRISVR